MSLTKATILIQIIIIGLFAGKLKAGIVTSSNDELKIKNEKMDDPNHNVKLSKLIDFFNTYDSIVSNEDRDENLSEQEIDDREIELLMLTLPRMGRIFKDEDGADLSSDEMNEIVNNEIKLFRRAIPRFGKRAIPRFGKRAIPRIG